MIIRCSVFGSLFGASSFDAGQPGHTMNRLVCPFGQQQTCKGGEAMVAAVRLHRGAPMQFAPGPRAVRAGDYIFTSSIYPVDERGHALGVDELRGETTPSLIEVQTRHCLEQLKDVLAEQGTTIDRVLKAEVHLAHADDFYEFKLVWREFFPKDPPARTTIEIGETLPFRAVRINMDAIALAGDSKLERQILRDPELADPIEAEAASL